MQALAGHAVALAETEVFAASRKQPATKMPMWLPAAMGHPVPGARPSHCRAAGPGKAKNTFSH